MEQFNHFGTAFVKEDRETGKVMQKQAVFVYATKSRRAIPQSQRLRLCRTLKSRTRATKSRDKIAGVTSVLILSPWIHLEILQQNSYWWNFMDCLNEFTWPDLGVLRLLG